MFICYLLSVTPNPYFCIRHKKWKLMLRCLQRIIVAPDSQLVLCGYSNGLVDSLLLATEAYTHCDRCVG